VPDRDTEQLCDVGRVTYLLDPPRLIEVELDPNGQPYHRRDDRLVGDLHVVLRWVVDVDWWIDPVSREYWCVLLRGKLRCEIYRDLDREAWFVERATTELRTRGGVIMGLAMPDQPSGSGLTTTAVP
jgi:hypothetical protein